MKAHTQAQLAELKAKLAHEHTDKDVAMGQLASVEARIQGAMADAKKKLASLGQPSSLLQTGSSAEELGRDLERLEAADKITEGHLNEAARDDQQAIIQANLEQ